MSLPRRDPRQQRKFGESRNQRCCANFDRAYRIPEYPMIPRALFTGVTPETKRAV
jgi:hypothetical protein